MTAYDLFNTDEHTIPVVLTEVKRQDQDFVAQILGKVWTNRLNVVEIQDLFDVDQGEKKLFKWKEWRKLVIQ